MDLELTAEQRRLARAALTLDDASLLAECSIDVYVASGPGGQHRNKTESGVRIVHLPTGLRAGATERRSQHQNREVALARLRALLRAWTFVPKPRRPTAPTRGSQRRRLDAKRRNADKKAGRRGTRDDG